MKKMVFFMLLVSSYNSVGQTRVDFGNRLEEMNQVNYLEIEQKFAIDLNLDLSCLNSQLEVQMVEDKCVQEIKDQVMEQEMFNFNNLQTLNDDSLLQYHISRLGLVILDYNALSCEVLYNQLFEPPVQLNGSVNKAAGQPCNNLDFELGDFTGWEQVLAVNDGSQPYAFVNPTTVTNFCVANGDCTTGFTGVPDPGSYVPNSSLTCSFNAEFFVHDNGTNTTCLNEPFDGSGDHVAILGRATGGRDVKRVTQTFQIQPNDVYLEVAFSVILEDPGHPVSDQPYFRIRAFDAVTGDLLPCSDYEVIANNALAGWVVLESNFSGPVMWGLPWTKKLIPVTAYQGQDITLEVTVGDCGQGAHFGQALVNASCTPDTLQVLLQAGPTFCAPAVLEAPDGYNYVWGGGQTTQQVSVSSPGTYTVNISSIGDPPACAATLSQNIIDCTVLPIEMIGWEVNCELSTPVISWEVMNEVNLSHYLIERSCDGQNFEVVDIVAPMYSDGETKHYSISDESMASCNEEVWYYRLSQFDNDGNSEEFGLKSVSCNLSVTEPIVRTLEEEITVEFDRKFTACLVSPDGKAVTSYFESTNEKNCTIHTSNLNQGMYLLVIKSDRNFVKRIFISKK